MKRFVIAILVIIALGAAIGIGVNRYYAGIGGEVSEEMIATAMAEIQEGQENEATTQPEIVTTADPGIVPYQLSKSTTLTSVSDNLNKIRALLAEALNNPDVVEDSEWNMSLERELALLETWPTSLEARNGLPEEYLSIQMEIDQIAENIRLFISDIELLLGDPDNLEFQKTVKNEISSLEDMVESVRNQLW